MKVPAFGTPEYPRWLNGPLTLACGKDLHYLCHGTISTLGINSVCLCECHNSSRSGLTKRGGA